MFKKVFGLYTV